MIYGRCNGGGGCHGCTCRSMRILGAGSAKNQVACKIFQVTITPLS